jgi:D-aspartate ligase
MATSDETAWLYTENADQLNRNFRVYQPSINCMRRILDKKLLAEAAASAGLTALPSWEARSLDELVALAPSLPYPILIKPRTHVHRIRNNKGVVVCSPTEMLREYRRFLSRETTGVARNVLLPDAELPLLQQFVRVTNEGVCSVSGFIDRTGELFVTRRATKILQRSQPVGVGVCFESLPPDVSLSNAVRRLCAELGYFGMFEVEFLRFNGDWAVIDFNPRLFNQVAMDISRGMPLPFLAYLDAAGDSGRLRIEVTKAQTEGADTRAVFCDQFTLSAIVAARTVMGRMSRGERAHWHGWLKRNEDCLVDAARSDSDPVPARIHALSELYLGLRAIPKFLRASPRALSGSAYDSIRAQL